VRSRAVWLWETKDLIFHGGERKGFFHFCNKKHIKDIFFQLQLSFKDATGRKPACTIEHQVETRHFLHEAACRGIRIHGLDGHPSYALRKNHPKALAIAQAVTDFNNHSTMYERFSGVHFDIEPYLLPGFQVAERKEILLEYLELNRKCAELIHSGDKGTAYGVDIPFWLAESVDNIDEETTYVVDFAGERKATSFHLVDICDNIGIMDYRNFAGGPDGIIAHGLNELEYAGGAKGKKVYIGVETSRYPSERMVFTYGLEKRQFNKRFLEVEKRLKDGFYFEGFKLRLLNDGINAHPGLVIPLGEKKTPLFERKLLKLARLLGTNFYGMDDRQRRRLLFDIKSVADGNIEFQGFDESEFRNEGEKEHFSFFETEERMLAKLTFAGTSEKHLEDVLSEAEAEFLKYPAFAGFAIHYYKSYHNLCTGIYI